MSNQFCYKSDDCRTKIGCRRKNGMSRGCVWECEMNHPLSRNQTSNCVPVVMVPVIKNVKLLSVALNAIEATCPFLLRTTYHFVHQMQTPLHVTIRAAKGARNATTGRTRKGSPTNKSLTIKNKRGRGGCSTRHNNRVRNPCLGCRGHKPC